MYKPYSHSKINNYKQCPRKFKYNYIDKLPKEWKYTIPLERGSLIHLIFEHSRDLKKIQAEKEFKEIMERKVLDKEAIKGCFQVYDNFIQSKAGKQLLSKKKLFNEMPLGLDYNLNIMEYNPDDKELKKELFLRGYIDSAVVAEGKTSDTLIVIDWKTGKSKTQEDQDWSQLLWYAIGLFSKMPFNKIIMCYAYVEHDKLNLKTVHRDEIDKYKQALWDTVDIIENDTEFNKNETYLCDWCDHRHYCAQDV